MAPLLHQISHHYGARLVLEEISLTAAPGELVALMGPSGCGKTTLLNLLAGLLSPTAGTVEQRATPIAYVFQEPRLFPWYTVLQNIALGLKAQGMAQRSRLQRARSLAESVGLGAAEIGRASCRERV